MRKLSRLAFLSILSLVLIACAPKNNNNNDDDDNDPVSVETNQEAYNYFYQSLANRLNAGTNTIISFETLLDDEVEYAKTAIIKKQGSIYYSNIHDTELVFTGSYVYFGPGYINRAEISFEQFLVMSFNSFYEIELKNFLFGETLAFTTLATGYHLALESKIFPHVYSLDLNTNSDHALVDATLTSEAYIFTREVVFSYEHPATISGVPLFNELPAMTNNRTAHLINFFEIMEAMTLYSENDVINREVYTSDNILFFPSTASESYWTSQTGGLHSDGESYSYYLNNKIYVYEAEYEPYFYQKVYYDSALSSLQFAALGNVFWLIESAMTSDISKTITGTTTEYSSTAFKVVLVNGVLDYVIEIDSNGFVKHDFDTTLRTISSPVGFVATDFISDEVSIDIGLTYNAYIDAGNLFDYVFLMEGVDPDQTDYSIALQASVSLVTAPVEVADMVYGVYYVYVQPTVWGDSTDKGDVLEVYYSTSSGKYRIYETILGVFYQKLA